jgi:BirA family biotin operon repressor/biotin-[acetyl-CoA-carboxylase] ligase
MYTQVGTIGANKAPHFFCNTTDSTMLDAMLASVHCCMSGTVYRADFQSSGMGRIGGRFWSAESGKNLLCTRIIAYPNPVYAGCTGLILALSVSDLLKKWFNIDAYIKWPNDVIIQNKKIAGILGQKSNNYLLLGLGLNIHQIVFPDELQNSTSLAIELEAKAKIPQVADFVVPIMESFDWYFSSYNITMAIELIQNRLWNKHAPITVVFERENRPSITAYQKGIRYDGCLELMLDNGAVCTISSGELYGARIRLNGCV